MENIGLVSLIMLAVGAAVGVVMLLAFFQLVSDVHKIRDLLKK